MVIIILLVLALCLSIIVSLRVDPPQLNLRWVVVACLIGAMLAGMKVPGF